MQDIRKIEYSRDYASLGNKQMDIEFNYYRNNSKQKKDSNNSEEEIQDSYKDKIEVLLKKQDNHHNVLNNDYIRKLLQII